MTHHELVSNILNVPQIVPCKLEKKVQSLMELICDVKAMEEAVTEMQYDAKKAPLGGVVHRETTFLHLNALRGFCRIFRWHAHMHLFE